MMPFLTLKRFRGFLLFCVVILLPINLLLSANVARAQWVTANPDILAKDVQKDLSDQVAKLTDSAFLQALSTVLINLFIYEVNTVAYNSAVWVASGGNAEEPLFDVRTATDYLKYTGATIASAAVDEIMNMSVADLSVKFGVNFPDDPYLRAAISNGIRSTYVPTLNYDREEFDFYDIKDNWQGYLISIASNNSLSTTQKTGEVLKTMSKSFDPGANEFTAAFAAYSQTIIDVQMEAQTETDELQINQHFLDLKNATSGLIETPASFISEKLAHSLEKSADAPFELTGGMLTGSDTLTSIGLMAGSVFTNTLISELIQKLEGGIFKDITSPTSAINPFDIDSVIDSSRERAQERNKALLAFKPLATADINLLSEFSSCPTAFRGISRQLYNCVMDTSFASAVTRADSGDPLTVSEAIEEGYLGGDWPIIPSGDTARNQDVNCYKYGFCHSNLVKLRKARIIPIGWELAAESVSNSSGSPVTLQEVIDGFYDCNEDGTLDEAHPWCHLIDPNWVLRYPQVQCRTMAYGQRLSASGTDARAEECVDMQSCISEDENGNCTGGWGYCVEEKNAWNFRGDDCPDQYASCQSFTTVSNEAVDYLTNTIDSGVCTADNAGCLWYATIKKEVDGAFDWPTVTDEPAAEERQNADRYRIYIDSDAESCSEAEAGCTALIERGEDVTLNMINNPSFDVDDDGDSWPDAWAYAGSTLPTYDATNTYSRTGETAVNPGASTLYQMGLLLNQNTFYTLSFYAKQGSSSSASLQSVVYLVDQTGEETPDLTGYSYTGDCAPTDLDGSDGLAESMSMTVTPSADGYERFTCTFTTPRLEHASKLLGAYIDFFPADVWIDDVQFEQGEEANIFQNGYGTDAENIDYVYGTLPPAYLGCNGSEDDPAECDNYAQICSSDDEGCQAYSPTNGDSTIFGVAKSVDECSSSCAGYDTYKQEPTRYEPNGSFPEYLIPSTATECDAEVVGCDEFTNLTDESKEYYTYLRACVTSSQALTNTSGDGEATFYTWEGSDVDGYQLKTWHLLESNLDVAIFGSVAKNGTEPGAAPCTTWSTSTGSISCTDNADNSDRIYDDYTEDCDEHDDIITNPDCREFYDENGDIHYRLWSNTVTVDDACVSYRKTDIAGLGEDTNPNDGTDDGEANCEDSGGYFDSDLNACRYFGLLAESTTCSEAVNGCREYTGGRSNNSRLAFEEFFEAGDLTNWESNSSTDTTLSNESIAIDGHSVLTTRSIWTHVYDYGSSCSTSSGCASGTGNLGGSCTVTNGQETCGTLDGELFAGKTYTLSFWAKGSGTVQPGFDIEAVTSSVELEVPFADAIDLGDTWHEYVVGPLDMSEAEYENFGDGTILLFKVSSGSTVYLDNVVLREGEDNVTILKDSWVTPAICDQDSEGNPSPQFQLGCMEYTDAEGETAYLKSFSKLCSEELVGCTGYYNTFNSDSTSGEMRNVECENVDTDADGSPDTATAATDCHLFSNGAGTAYDTNSPVLCTISGGEDSCSFDSNYLITYSAVLADTRLGHITFPADTVRTPADRDVYAILGDFTCDDSSAGCMELGQPTFSSDGSVVEEYESVYYINDPDSYDDMLCSTDAVGCNAFDAGDEGTFYFKDPMGQTCEYKTNVTIEGGTYSGWFRTDENEFCAGTGVCSDGATSCSRDADCRVGACSDNSAACYSDFDCNTDATCATADPDSTCTINEGSYLIGGDASGIWRNGDSNYENWVGTCSAEYSGCSEFQDPMDYDEEHFYNETDGLSYYYIDNDNLDENSLLTSAKCDDQVSQKLGCVLFNDTGESGFDFNASASYTASIHADVMFGDQPFDLVDPIDCDSGEGESTIITPSGTSVDLCAKRCVYDNEDLYPVTLSSGISLLDNDSSTGYTQDEIYTFGTSCYEDTDCATYDSETGDAVAGDCKTRTVVSINSADSTDKDYELVPRLENDTNRILKVNRDRQCSKWLTCDSSQTVWDETTASYKTICDSVDLCTEYSAGDGDASFCSAWDSDSEPLILDAERYASRDVTWYGSELSSYAIPDAFPAQFLNQVNIAPAKRCQNTVDETATDSDTPCDSDSECTETDETCESVNETDYRLAYTAGSCDTGYGGECSVGYCSESGTLCTEAADCPGSSEACLVGKCYSTPSTATVCSSDDECTDDQTCIGGTCLDNQGSCRNAASDEDYTCPSDTSGGNASCYISANVYGGTCYRDTCVVNPNGAAFNDETSETQVCRAYPEKDSPFPARVVDTWVELGIGANILVDRSPTETIDFVGAIRLIPYTRLAGFDRAHICSAGEDCECDYKKFASSTGISRYAGIETAATDIVAELTEESGLGSTSSTLGICSGGSNDGAFCLVDESESFCGDGDSDTTSASEGTCYVLSQEDSIMGMKGYCLERDTGINILGDSDFGACLTWLPIDQLQGSTDLYAKYKTAGYFEDVYMCNEVRPFFDVGESAHDGTEWDSGDIACAARPDWGVGCTEENSYEQMYDCLQEVSCPENFFAIMGQCDVDSAENGYYADACDDHGSDNNGCPYVCIPENSRHDDDDSVCEPNPDNYDYVEESDSGTMVYAWGKRLDEEDPESSYAAFDAVIDDTYSDCKLRGVEWTDDVANDLAWIGGGTGGTYVNGDHTDGYWDLDLDYHLYAGCSEVTQVSSVEESYGWTDRLLTPGVYSVDGDYGGITYSGLNYAATTTPTPFGSTFGAPEEITPNDPPFRVATCYDESDITFVLPDGAGGDFTLCQTGTTADHPDGLYGTTPADPYARAFIDYELTNSYDYVDDIWLTNPSGTDSYTAVWGRINQVFAWPTFGSLYSWTGSLSSDTEYSEDASGAVVYDAYGADVRGSQGNSPTIWALDNDHCYGNYCREGEENGLTVNGSNETDQQGDGGFFRATLKFYAAADKNQLPIRRVIVDWGDGDTSGSDDGSNYYKNHRGLLETSTTKAYCDVCGEGGGAGVDTDGDGDIDVACEWGMTSDSCDPNYFTYQHNFTCDDGDLLDYSACSDADSDGLPDSTPCVENDACVFRPRIHVRDNWGWCTGTCVGGPDTAGDGSGCYDSDGAIGTEDPSLDECLYDQYPALNSAVDPWVYYDGVITVEP